MFPGVAKYLREEMPKVVDVPRIVHFMLRIGKLDKQELAAALDPNNLPELVPKFPFAMLHVAPIPTRSIVRDLWAIPKDFPNRIFLNLKLFEDLENRTPDSLTSSHVSVPKGSPDSREFSGVVKDGLTEQLVGSKSTDPKFRSLGFFKDTHVFSLGATLLCALVDFGLWTKEKKIDSRAAAQFALEVYRTSAFLARP
jgi:hypothetical protein